MGDRSKRSQESSGCVCPAPGARRPDVDSSDDFGKWHLPSGLQLGTKSVTVHRLISALLNSSSN